MRARLARGAECKYLGRGCGLTQREAWSGVDARAGRGATEERPGTDVVPDGGSGVDARAAAQHDGTAGDKPVVIVSFAIACWIYRTIHKQTFTFGVLSTNSQPQLSSTDRSLRVVNVIVNTRNQRNASFLNPSSLRFDPVGTEGRGESLIDSLPERIAPRECWIVLAHEDTIQKRWKKRTAVRRKQLLQEIDSKLPMTHAPEISAFSEGLENPDKLNDFILPYQNLEDLTINNGMQSYPRMVLGLLHARAHYPPSQFAWFDAKTLHFGFAAGAIPRQLGVCCGMISFRDEGIYGKVLRYDAYFDHSDAHSPNGGEMEHLLRESMSSGDGLAVLETQAKLIKFLLAVVFKILVDVDLAKLKPELPLPAPAIPILNTTFQWQSTAHADTLMPYGPPPVFSIDDIAVQHLADLRTDPAA
ncbi:hypothetical protein C8R47DRAFT_1203911 [Mycena vitilis]|nr:hypothetical protein C8R47DRAFT_1203911 [Mycena vitilis]